MTTSSFTIGVRNKDNIPLNYNWKNFVFQGRDWEIFWGNERKTWMTWLWLVIRGSLRVMMSDNLHQLLHSSKRKACGKILSSISSTFIYFQSRLIFADVWQLPQFEISYLYKRTLLVDHRKQCVIVLSCDIRQWKIKLQTKNSEKEMRIYLCKKS